MSRPGVSIAERPHQTLSHSTDPYAEAPAPARHWLHHLNPLAKALPVIPAIVLLVFARDLLTPALFLVLSYLVILSGTRLTRRMALLLFVAVPVGLAAITLGFSLWVSPTLVAGTPGILSIGDWTLRTGALAIGAATALRLGAILALALIGGLTTTGTDLVRAGVQQLRIPYRIGYTALAAYRFVPRFGYELSIIRAAHRVRGHHGGRGPFARLARGWGYIVPLLAGGIRHAERVALAMDARAFGAHPTRTERHLVPWRVRDTVFAIAVLAASAALLLATFPWTPIGAS
ncbi:energy-coupling factor transporter transmembrane protein EcfT [Microbacterium sp. MAH-37]|nr:energy-coupling factor transporter transmembrane component T [Microbacterium sp. MAH-37]MVQ41671.1 energy-coupling factor transporter transmembrane protein EcfT [Microbacterium sp. MAH-37]